MVDSLSTRDNKVIKPFEPMKDSLAAEPMTQFIVVFEDRINELMWDIYKNEKAGTKKIGSVRISRKKDLKTDKKHVGKYI